MKSLLGSLGLALVSLACSGNSDVVFDDSGLTGTSGKGTAPTGGTSTGGSEGTSGNPSTGGKGSGGAGMNGGTSGSTGAAGSEGGDAGEGPVTMTPDAIFVAVSGTDSDDCGLEPDDACETVSRGIARSVAAQKPSVYVQAGTYAEVVTLAPGVVVLGGFDADWQSGDRTDEAHRVTLKGTLHAGSQEYISVWAHDLDESAALQNLVIVGADAEGQKASTKNGRASYAIHAVSAKLALQDVDIVAGTGAPGLPGDAGQDAALVTATDGMNGGTGADGSSAAVTCDVDTVEGGPGGVNSCQGGPDTSETNGGKGGLGGARDTSCVGPQQIWNYTAQAGGVGTDAPRVLGLAGKGGSAGSGGGPPNGNPNVCSAAGGGNPGAVENGVGGKAATGGKLENGFWYTLSGGSGGTGKNGGGGGGGGGSGGCDLSGNKMTDVRGAGGGGGGAGGCAARGGGGGGGGGGGSFGIFAIGSTVDVKRVTVALGNGGAAGKGGAGGQGQTGGVGRDGGTNANPSGAPGKGGNGGHGGHGGGGAGGGGGSSYGAVLASGSSLNGTLMVSGGSAGLGGDGGLSAPSASEVESDGNAGERGPDGVVGEKLEL